MPVHEWKIDQSFVMGMANGSDDAMKDERFAAGELKSRKLARLGALLPDRLHQRPVPRR